MRYTNRKACLICNTLKRVESRDCGVCYTRTVHKNDIKLCWCQMYRTVSQKKHTKGEPNILQYYRYIIRQPYIYL